MRYKITKTKKDKRLVKSNKSTVDGIELKSGLEREMYNLLKKNGVSFNYEPSSILLLENFSYDACFYAKLSNGKGDYIDRSKTRVKPITYKPDFIVEDKKTGYKCVIETKGLLTESANLRIKMYKKTLKDRGECIDFFMPRTKSDCQKTIETILWKLKQN
jgi:hypothetical protein